MRIDDNASKAFDAIASAIKSASKEMSAYLELAERVGNTRMPAPFVPSSSYAPPPAPASSPLPSAAPTPLPEAPPDALIGAIEQVRAGVRALQPEALASHEAMKGLFQSLDDLDGATDLPYVAKAIDDVLAALEGLDNVDSVEPLVDAFEALRRGIDGVDPEAEDLADRLEKVRRAARLAGADGSRHFDKLERRAGASLDKTAEKTKKVTAETKRWSFSLKSIGEAYLGIQGLIFGAKSLSGIFEAADQRTMLRGQLAGMSEQQRGGYSVDTIDQSLTQKASAVGYDKGAFAELSMGFMQGTSGAFGSMGEAVKFSELLSKQFHASGVGAERASRAMEQLRQGLGKGALEYEDLKSILESAPQLVELMAKELGVSTMEMRKLTSEGKVTGDVIKKAIFNNAEQINASFAAMPVTWEMTFNRMKNAFFEAADPILQRLAAMASSDSFQRLSRALMRFAFAFMRALDFILPRLVPIADAFVGMAEAISNNIDLVAQLAVGLGLVVGIYQVWASWKKVMIALDAIMKATNPYLLIVSAVMAAVIWIRHLWETNLDFHYGALGTIAALDRGWTVAWSHVAEGFSKLVGYFLTGVGLMLYAIQETFNAAISAYNKVTPGDELEYLSFGDDVINYGQGFTDSKPWEDKRKIADEDYESYVKKLHRDKNEAIDAAKKSAELNEGKDEPVELEYGQSMGKPLHTKGTTKIDKDSIALLKDIASVEIVNRYTTVRPKISASFGDVRETADVNAIMDVLSTRIVDGVGASLIAAGGAA